MRTITTPAIVAAMALGLGALTACTTDPELTPAPTVEATTPTTISPTCSLSPSETPSPTPLPSPLLDADQIAAQNVVNEFFRISNELSKDPEQPLQPLADITTGQTQAVYVKEIADFREMNAIQVGDVEWGVLSVSPVMQRDSEKVAVVEVCTDNSTMDVVDQQTKESILPEERSTSIRWTIDAVEDNGYWRVGDLTNTAVKQC